MRGDRSDERVRSDERKRREKQVGLNGWTRCRQRPRRGAAGLTITKDRMKESVIQYLVIGSTRGSTRGSHDCGGGGRRGGESHVLLQ